MWTQATALSAPASTAECPDRNRKTPLPDTSSSTSRTRVKQSQGGKQIDEQFVPWTSRHGILAHAGLTIWLPIRNALTFFSPLLVLWPLYFLASGISSGTPYRDYVDVSFWALFITILCAPCVGLTFRARPPRLEAPKSGGELGRHQYLLYQVQPPWFKTVVFYLVLSAILLLAFDIVLISIYVPAGLPRSDPDPNKDVPGPGWKTGTLIPPGQCSARVEAQQVPLFTNPRIYSLQFLRNYTRVIEANDNSTFDALFDSIPTRKWRDHAPLAYYFELFRKLQDNPVLCARGFQGNIDLYGMGVRLGIYLQWLSSWLASHFQSDRRQELQTVYLGFSLAMCLTAIILSTVSETCVFGIDIIVLYWLYWGGYLCVFATTPSIAPSTNLLARWMGCIRTNWNTVTIFITNSAMVYHGIWFAWKGYDQVFARMPCGTYHSLMGYSALDPSEVFWALRDWLTVLVFPVTLVAIPAPPVVALLMIPELNRVVRSSAIFRAILPRARTPAQGVTESEDSLQRSHTVIRKAWARFRRACKLPRHSRSGMYFLTLTDANKQWILRCAWAGAGLIALSISIVSIEWTLALNRVQGVYSMESTGQYVSFIIGVASLVTVCWTLVHERIEKRRPPQQEYATAADRIDTELGLVTNFIIDALHSEDITDAPRLS